MPGTLSQFGAMIISPSYVRSIYRIDGGTFDVIATAVSFRIFRFVRPHAAVSLVMYCVTFLDRPSFRSKLSGWGSTGPSCKM